MPNEILDEIDQAHSRLSPPARAAIARVTGQAPLSMDRSPVAPPAEAPPEQSQGAGQLAPPQAPVEAPNIMDTGEPQPPAASMSQLRPPGPSMPPIVPRKTEPEVARQSEYDRLTQGPGAKSGVDQIKSPWARIPLQILSGIGDAVAPGLTMGIPGTRMHHNLLVSQQRGAVDQDVEQRDKAAGERLKYGQAAEQESLPAFHQAQNELATTKATDAVEINRLKQAELETSHRNTEDINRTRNEGVQATAQAKDAATLAQHGFQRNESGDIEPLPYEKMSQEQQAVHDLRAAQADAAQAQAELNKAKTANVPEATQLAHLRLQQAEQRMGIAQQRLGLSTLQTNARLYGTSDGPGGTPLPGALLTDTGSPVGSTNAANVRPTGTERGRADLAESAQEQLEDMRAIITRHPEYFGPGAGRKQEFESWVGSIDPDAKAFQTARTILSEHGSGVFGARSEGAALAQAVAAGEFKNNPDAIVSALAQMEKAFKKIGSKGTMRTVGSNAAAAQPVVPAAPAPSGAPLRARDPQGKLHEAPAGTPLPSGWKLEGK